MKSIFHFIFRNWFAKIISIALAILLWVYVGVGQTRNANFPGGIPLELKNVPQNYMAITDIDKVTVRIVSETETFKSLSAESFSATADLAGLSIGTHDIKVNVEVKVPNVQIVEITPQSVLVRLEPKIEKEVPVAVQIEGKAGDGLVPGEWKAEPNKVKVSGARSIVNGLMEATAKIQLDGQTSDLTRSVRLVGLDANGKTINNLQFTPDDSTVTVPIVKASNVKTVGIKAVLKGQPQEGYWVSKIETEPSTVVVTASENLIPELSYVETSEIDVSGLNKNYTTEAKLKPQSGVSVLDNVSAVKVRISIAKNTTTKEIQAGFRWDNLASNLKVTSTEPQQVVVLVSASEDILSDLKAEDVVATVDLSDKDAPGTYSIDINRSNISTPVNVSVMSVVPSAINVRLENK